MKSVLLYLDLGLEGGSKMKSIPLYLDQSLAKVCAARVTVVGSVCVCVSVKSHLTSGVSLRPENTVTY